MKNLAVSTDNKHKFYAIGLNYKKADAKLRGVFSISKEYQAAILREAKTMELPALAVLSTCNRTEMYGFAENPYQLIKLMCKYTGGELEDFERIGYVYTEQEAILHLFRVGTGLDSQILGDFEIISQLRDSFKRAKEEGLVNAYMERLANRVIQASKRVKNETTLSTGSASVSYAAVRYIMENVADVSRKKILLFGTGKIGRNTIENLVKHSKNEGITLINRSKEKAEAIAGKFKLIVKDFENLGEEIKTSDILIVATGANQPTVTKKILEGRSTPLLILDLSIPENVEEAVHSINGVEVVHVDQLSKITEDTLHERETQIPLAEQIIEESMLEFIEWATARRFAPAIRALKEKFNDIKASEIAYQNKKNENYNVEHAEILGDRIIQRILAHFANHLSSGHVAINDHLEMITEVFHLELKD